MTKEYALASAYGELMERLENKALYRSSLKYASANYPGKKQNGFVYFPDEIVVEQTGLEINTNLQSRFFPNLHNLLKLPLEHKYRSIYAPFFILGENEYRPILFPVEYYRAMCGSTGMCAGNCMEEAIVQGINEIVERYVLQSLFVNPEPLPNIPIELFLGSAIYDKLQLLQQQFTVEVKDCSLGRGLPVAGLKLVDSEGNISFRLGADFSLITAVERCFTETFQGSSSQINSFVDYHISNPPSIQEYQKCLINGSGRFPIAIFQSSNLKSRFPHIDFSDYNEELHYYLDYFSARGYRVYVKDNSFLSFPAYTVYIPGLSDLYYQLCNMEAIVYRSEQEFCEVDPYLHLLDYPTEKIEELLSDDSRQYGMEWNTKNPESRTPLIRFYFYVILRKYNQASKILNSYIDRYFKQETPAILLCLKELTQDLSLGLVTNTNDLRLRYGDVIINECRQAFSQDISALSPYLSSCFDCSNCKMNSYCFFEQLVSFEGRIQARQRLYYQNKYLNLQNKTP